MNLELTFNDTDKIEEVRTGLNEVLMEWSYPLIVSFEFEGPEDIQVKFETGDVIEISNETTFTDLLEEIDAFFGP